MSADNLQNLHEMIRNLSAYIKSLEVVCENGVKLAKNFEYLLSPGPMAQGCQSAPPSTANLDSDVLTQSVATWELAHKVATADANALISELLPLLQDAIQTAMKDPQVHSSNSYEVFRSCFSAFFQIQWRFCSLYIQCSSCPARSPTTTSFSSGDRRESTESFGTGSFGSSSSSLPRSSISGSDQNLSSPSPQVSHHTHHYGHHHSRSRNSSLHIHMDHGPPLSPLYGDGAYPYLFRRWSAHTHNYNANTMSSGPSASSNLSGVGGSQGATGGSCTSGLSTGLSFNRRWSVPASSSGTHNQGSASNSENRKTGIADGGVDASYDCGLLDAINLLSRGVNRNTEGANNLLSTKPPSPIPVKILPPAEEEAMDEFYMDQPIVPSGNSRRRVIYAPSESIPGVVLTTCGSDAEMSMENLRRSSHQSLRVPYTGDTPPSSNSTASSIITSPTGQPSVGEYRPEIPSQEYSLFGNSPSPTQGT